MLTLLDACEDVLEAARGILDSLIYDPDGVHCLVSDDRMYDLRRAGRELEG